MVNACRYSLLPSSAPKYQSVDNSWQKFQIWNFTKTRPVGDALICAEKLFISTVLIKSLIIIIIIIIIIIDLQHRTSAMISVPYSKTCYFSSQVQSNRGFTNASDHEQFGLRTNFPNTKRLGWRTVSRVTNTQAANIVGEKKDRKKEKESPSTQ